MTRRKLRVKSLDFYPKKVYNISVNKKEKVGNKYALLEV